MVSQRRPLQKASQQDEDQEDVSSALQQQQQGCRASSYAQLQLVTPVTPARCLADASFPYCLQNQSVCLSVRSEGESGKSFAAVLITLQEQVIDMAHAIACNQKIVSAVLLALCLWNI